MQNPKHLETESLHALAAALTKLDAGFGNLPPFSSAVESGAITDILGDVAGRLQSNYPYFHPLYAGQMLKPPHPVARAAYALAMWINPNNHALDGGRASSAMEKETVAELAAMIGWEEHLGHLTGGGTMANLEALWVANRVRPGVVVASTQAHYTHSRISGVLGLKFGAVACDRDGRMDVASLKRRLEAGDVGTVVATIGTTATGSVDPLQEILALREKYNFRLHADAAYGGYFALAGNLEEHARTAFDHLHEADSVVIDPHKHGLQPYGCGCVIFRDPAVGRFYKHDSPYTYFSSGDLHLGEISLECSRAGAAAVALWATQRVLPLVRGGEFAGMLASGREAAIKLHRLLSGDSRFMPAFPPELDIVVWGVKAVSVTESSALARRVFDEAAAAGLHLALAELPVEFFDVSEMKKDRETLLCLRSVLMKPEHAEWVDRIWAILDGATARVLQS